MLARRLALAPWIVGGAAIVFADWLRPGRLVRARRLLATAVDRHRKNVGIDPADTLSAAMIELLPGRVAVLDRAGTIVRMNASWRDRAPRVRRGARGGGLLDPSAEIGANFLDGFRRAAAYGSSAASDALRGIEAVLAGTRREFAMEYAGDPAAGERYFEMTAEALQGPAGGALVIHHEITERKRAEVVARQSSHEVAHLSRVAAVAGLATSLAHELRQPLTAIRANAQAASRLLDADPPDLATVREIVRDVADAVTRATGVIDGMRELLKGDGPHLAPMDVNDVARAVVRLAATDATVRRATLLSELEAELPPVLGDPVQLEQVLLNLVLNALEAMERPGLEVRRVVISTRAASGSVAIAVRDTGPGVPDADVFESFYTTKPHGLGIGLAIARRIVEAHGGRLWVENAEGGGALFHVLLPATAECAP